MYNPYYLPLPEWAIERDNSWTYCGVIDNPPWLFDIHGLSYKQLRASTLRSDHGELREVDEYPEGCTCWCREVHNESL